MPWLAGSEEAFPGRVNTTRLFSHHSLGICPWVTVGRGYRISLAPNPHGLSYTNVFFPLLKFSSKLLLCLLPGNPCELSSQMPLCVPAMSHCWKILFPFSYFCGKKFPIHLFLCFFRLTTFFFHVQFLQFQSFHTIHFLSLCCCHQTELSKISPSSLQGTPDTLPALALPQVLSSATPQHPHPLIRTGREPGACLKPANF